MKQYRGYQRTNQTIKVSDQNKGYCTKRKRRGPSKFLRGVYLWEKDATQNDVFNHIFITLFW